MSIKSGKPGGWRVQVSHNMELPQNSSKRRSNSNNNKREKYREKTGGRISEYSSNAQTSNEQKLSTVRRKEKWGDLKHRERMI